MIRLFLVFLLLLAPGCLRAASFDCAKARTSVEKAICSSPELGAADDKLGQAYQAALTKVPEAAMLVREAQRKWLQSADRNCNPRDENYPYAKCLAIKWTVRADFLNRIVVRMGGVPFFYRDIWLGEPCDEEDLTTGLAKTGPHTANSEDADTDDEPCWIHATWPVAISNAPKWRAWNIALLDEARRFNASQDNEDNVPDHWVRFPDRNGVEVSIDLNLITPTLVVATINRNYEYAHPMHQERAFNWLIKQDRELKPEDIFRPDSAWKTWMKKRVVQVVLEDEPSEEAASDSQKERAARAAELEMRSSYWRVEREGLYLIFTQDAVGYPDCITTNTTFSWSELKPYLNPTFEIPR
jgi:uncharacterized protein YecT (DUF1311 family)